MSIESAQNNNAQCGCICHRGGFKFIKTSMPSQHCCSCDALPLADQLKSPQQYIRINPKTDADYFKEMQERIEKLESEQKTSEQANIDAMGSMNIRIDKLRQDYRASYVERIKEGEKNIDSLIEVNKSLIERIDKLESSLNKDRMTQTDREEISKWMSIHEEKVDKLETSIFDIDCHRASHSDIDQRIQKIESDNKRLDEQLNVWYEAIVSDGSKFFGHENYEKLMERMNELQKEQIVFMKQAAEIDLDVNARIEKVEKHVASECDFSKRQIADFKAAYQSEKNRKLNYIGRVEMLEHQVKHLQEQIIRLCANETKLWKGCDEQDLRIKSLEDWTVEDDRQFAEYSGVIIAKIENLEILSKRNEEFHNNLDDRIEKIESLSSNEFQFKGPQLKRFEDRLNKVESMRDFTKNFIDLGEKIQDIDQRTRIHNDEIIRTQLALNKMEEMVLKPNFDNLHERLNPLEEHQKNCMSNLIKIDKKTKDAPLVITCPNCKHKVGTY